MSTPNSVNHTADDTERPPATPAELAQLVESYSRAIMLGFGGITL